MISVAMAERTSPAHLPTLVQVMAQPWQREQDCQTRTWNSYSSIQQVCVVLLATKMSLFCSFQCWTVFWTGEGGSSSTTGLQVTPRLIPVGLREFLMRNWPGESEAIARWILAGDRPVWKGKRTILGWIIWYLTYRRTEKKFNKKVSDYLAFS